MTVKISNKIVGYRVKKADTETTGEHQAPVKADTKPVEMNENIERVHMTICRRFIRSAMTPPHTDRISIGPSDEKLTKPNMKAESVRSLISHKRPAIKAHMPKLEKAPPNQNSR